MAETFTDYLDRYFPVIDLDTADQQRHILVVTFAGGAKSAVVQFTGLAAGAAGEHLSIDVHAFASGQVARAAVFGMENGARYEGFDDNAPGRCHGRPAVRGVTVLIGAQTGTGPQS